MSLCLYVRTPTRRVLRQWDDEVVKDFGFTLDQINWFGNVVNVVYLPSAFVMPYLYGSLGVRKTVSYFASSLLLQTVLRVVSVSLPSRCS